MPTYLNTFWFDKNGHLLQLDDILALRNSQPTHTPTPSPTPEPGPQPTPTPEPPAAMTIRFRFSNPDFDPNTLEMTTGTWTKVQYAAGNDWDFTRDSTSWYTAFDSKLTSDIGIVDIIDNGDLSTVTDFGCCFKTCTGLRSLKLIGTTNATAFVDFCYGCTNLTTATITDTGSNVNWTNTFGNCSKLTDFDNINMDNAMICTNTFGGCTSLHHIKTFPASKLVSVDNLFVGCINVEYGMYDLYVELSTHGQPWIATPSFQSCGTATESGRAERAKIPVMWGGDLA